MVNISCIFLDGVIFRFEPSIRAVVPRYFGDSKSSNRVIVYEIARACLAGFLSLALFRFCMRVMHQ